MLFFALTFSWVDEISRTYLPKPAALHLVFLKEKKGTRYEYFIILTVPPNIQTRKISLTEKPYELLQETTTSTKGISSFVKTQFAFSFLYSSNLFRQ